MIISVLTFAKIAGGSEMQTVLLTIVAIAGVLLIAAVGLMLSHLSEMRRQSTAAQTAVGLLQQQMENLRQSQQTLSQIIDKNLQAGQQTIHQFLTHSGQTLGELKEQMGKLKSDSEQMLRIGQEVRKLQDILKAPKLRGQIGEYSLEGLLKNILPAEHFTIQHSFKNGRTVDALIRLPDYSIPVDAKFPLSAFEKMAAAESEEEKTQLRRQFQSDVRKHIDKIAESYIQPAEGTLDFALMYIPAENVYYETIIRYESDKTDLLEYALSKKVIPVSPNLLYAYLMTIVMGLHGMQIEEQAAQIRAALNQLAGSFSSFIETWEILGKHLRNAQNQYEEGGSKLNKFTLQLNQIQQPLA
jgi:DNA recombination protein RmuC